MKRISLLFVLAIFLVTGVLAQEEIKAIKYKDVTWHRVVMVNYKPGKITRAKEIIKMYQAAGAAAQTKGPEEHWMVTGKYDVMLIWHMEGGPSDMEWQRSPDGAKWTKEFIKQQGSKEAADKIRQEYASLIANSDSYISRKNK